jgi:Plasmid pRiA4b ORF-3-like protein
MSLPDRTGPRSYTFQITLLGVTPPVWRLVAVPGTLTLERLHQVIQLAMGWGRARAYRFDIGGSNYGESTSEDGARGRIDSRGITLDQLGLTQGACLTYIYDSKDDWVHHLTVQGVAPSSPMLAAPALLGGAGACPPETVDGPGSYAALLNALRTPDSPAGQHAREQLGQVTDPAVWEPGSAAERLPGIGAPPSGSSETDKPHSGGRSRKRRRGR